MMLQIAGIMMMVTALAAKLFLLGATIYGLVLSFSASVVVGIISLIVSPVALIVGLAEIFADAGLAQKLATVMGL